MPKPKTGVVCKTGGYYNSVKKDKESTFEATANISTSLSVFSYDEMRNHPTLAAGLAQIKYPILSVDWFLSGADTNKVKFIDSNLRPIWTKLINDMLTAFDYGFAPFQKLYRVEGGKVYIDSMRALKPHYIKVLIDGKDNFMGIRSSFEGKAVDLSRDESAVFTYNLEFGNLYGISRLRAARYPYNVHKYIMEMTSMFFESYGDPRLLYFVPEGKTRNPETGQLIDNMSYVADKAASFSNGGSKALVVPARRKDEAQYDARVLESSRTGADYITYLNYLDARMLQAILIPTTSVMPTERGSYAMQKELNSMFAFQFDAELAKVAEFIKNEIINPLLVYNFGKGTEDSVAFEYMPMTKKDIELLRNTALSLVQTMRAKPDMKWLSRQLGIPLEESEPPEPKETEEKPVEMGKHKCGSHLHLEKTKRELKTFEKKVNFNKINLLFEKSKNFNTELDAVLDDMKVKFIKEAEQVIKSGDPELITKFELEYKNKYRNLFVSNSMTTFEDSLAEVRKEMGLGDKKISKAAKEMQKIKAVNVANKQLNDIEFGVKNTVVSNIATGAKWGAVEIALKNMLAEQKDSIQTGVELTIQEFIDDGRRYGVDGEPVEVAVWSAILDDVTCPVCESFDSNLVVKTDSPEYTEYSPGNMHSNCRCIWVYVMEGEENPPEVNVPQISQKDMDRYIRR